jgi:hypothetical protein
MEVIRYSVKFVENKKASEKTKIIVEKFIGPYCTILSITE